jgi:hypothetical protein
LLGAFHGLQYQLWLHHQAEGIEFKGRGLHGGSPVVVWFAKKLWRLKQL